MGKALGIVALIFGIIGMIISLVQMVNELSWWPPPFSVLAFFPYFPNIVAIICGSIGIIKDDSPGLAIAGLILGSIGLIIAVAATIIGLARW